MQGVLDETLEGLDVAICERDVLASFSGALEVNAELPYAMIHATDEGISCDTPVFVV